jgi:CRP-like cAMP-binding protein
MRPVGGEISEGPVEHAAWICRHLGRLVQPELAPLAPEDAAELAAELRDDEYDAGTYLFRAGQPPSRIHIVRRGAVELSCALHGRPVVLQILRPGDVVGDVPLFLRMPESFDAIALEDSRILSIDSLALHRLLTQRPQLAWRWMLSVSSRMMSAQARMVELLAGGLEAQIALVLLRRADHGFVHLRQGILAELVGGRRPSVNRVLKRLETQGLLRLHYGHVQILDEAGLAALTGVEQASATTEDDDVVLRRARCGDRRGRRGTAAGLPAEGAATSS